MDSLSKKKTEVIQLHLRNNNGEKVKIFYALFYISISGKRPKN